MSPLLKHAAVYPSRRYSTEKDLEKSQISGAFCVVDWYLGMVVYHLWHRMQRLHELLWSVLCCILCSVCEALSCGNSELCGWVLDWGVQGAPGARETTGKAQGPARQLSLERLMQLGHRHDQSREISTGLGLWAGCTNRYREGTTLGAEGHMKRAMHPACVCPQPREVL